MVDSRGVDSFRLQRILGLLYVPGVADRDHEPRRGSTPD
jgi:hypothetical protein